MNWLRIFQHLLPTARAWWLTPDKVLRDFFLGFAPPLDDTREFFDQLFVDIDPQQTTQLEEWEFQFALPPASLTPQQRRDRLDGRWKAQGGQSPRYIQDTLQAAGFDVYVHEWWVPDPLHPTGGSVDGDSVPVARNPNDYLFDGTGGLPFLMYDGGTDSQDGDLDGLSAIIAQDGQTAVEAGYPLVNKILESSDSEIGDGDADMLDGGLEAQDGGIVTTYSQKQYTIPVDPTKYPYFLYIGAETFPEIADLSEARRDEFEDLCLKICPTEQWLGILVQYS